MKETLLAILIFVFLANTGGQAESGKEGISRADIAGGPSKFCKVIKEPDPALLGGWKCVHQNFHPKLARYQKEPIQYYLAKYGDRYAIYFYRFKKEADGAVYRGWRDFTIDGDRIYSKTGVRFFLKDGAVHYSWKNDKPTPMSRIEDF